MGWRDALNGALDVLAPGSPSATTEVEADGDFFTRLDRHWRNAYAELGTPPRDVETGYTSRAHSHGLELIRRGRAVEAERVLRALSDSGNAGARTDLGVLHFRAGVLNLAEQEWQQAAGQGDIRAAHYLGVLLVQRGRRTEAEQWLRRAFEAGRPQAAVDLGLVLKRSGRLQTVETWLKRAADSGVADAGVLLGLIDYDRGNLNGAEASWRQAAERSSPDAAHNLGLLLATKGQYAEAREWIHRAEDAGHSLTTRAWSLIHGSERRAAGPVVGPEAPSHGQDEPDAVKHRDR
ncbi:lipopolysaccharide assembly protein LapB [Streptomyces sp. V1I1]|uniref:tetratricopeptide repeat protein n=1 Tax=Streptomyces sp. V1I1 TaxID=3042272 RepID=UPI00277F6979|nr:tetratricopeptide repeat protein [Streptomyces sp. V1I1]MDQ0945717.1 Flp pilus assembly protein TadD [Streptomyces sp. V1I1]